MLGAKNASEFVALFFSELEKRGIPYVIIHSYEKFPERVKGDIDYAVYERDFSRLTEIQRELGHKFNWAVVQRFQHGIFACYNVLVSLDDPQEVLKLDACSNYARARRLLVPDYVLLDGRQKYGDYWIPCPSAEFIYELTKLFDAKSKNPENYISRLRELWEQDKESAQSHFTRAFGDTGHTLEEWFSLPPIEWKCLRSLMLRKNKFGLLLIVREAIRVAIRAIRPTGVRITLLGSDGSGKTTAIELLKKSMGAFFRRFRVYHFLPKLFKSKEDGPPVFDPHEAPPYGALHSMAKIGYYFLSYWAAFFFKLIHSKVKSTLIIFDRDFDDLLVDSKRYRLSATCVGLIRVLRIFAPKSDITFVLDVEPDICYRRKPELSLDELKRQRGVLRSLVASSRRYSVVDAGQASDEVNRAISGKILDFLLERQEKRKG